MSSPTVLVVLNTNAAYSCGMLRGLIVTANERGWALLHYQPGDDVTWLVKTWNPSAIVIGAGVDEHAVTQLDGTRLVSLAVDRSSAGIASICPDEEAIGKLAAEHLLATGLRHVATFRTTAADFAVARERAFVALARAAGVQVHPSCAAEVPPPPSGHDPSRVLEWIRGLPKPCGVFACTDFWGKAVAACARAANVRIPDDLAIVGVDNDPLQCELVVPALSSVVVPWREIGEKAGELVEAALQGKGTGRRIIVPPVSVMARRSSELLAVNDELVAKAVHYIRAHARGRVNLNMIVDAVGSGRQRLERRFRRSLNRTIQEEIRRTRVDAARRLLETSDAELRVIARSSGFTNATLLNLAFQRELGMAPGAYRRRIRLETEQFDAQ